MSQETEAGVAQKPWALPEGATQLVLVRHGASADAVRGEPFPMLDGRGDPPLSPAGHQEAATVARRLAAEPFSRLFATSLRRTQQTAAPLAEATGKEVEILSDLVEVGLGPWSSGEYRIRAAAGDPIVVRAHEEERWELIPGAEGFDAFAERIDRGLNTAADLSGPGATSVVVVHGGVIGEALRLAVGCTPFSFIHADNGSITRVIRQPTGRWLVRSFNDVNHFVA